MHTERAGSSTSRNARARSTELFTDGMQVVPVGYVRSTRVRCDQVPGEGAPAEILVSTAYAEALHGVELSSHLIVLGWLHEASRNPLRSSHAHLHPGRAERGIFATRCPSRRNPISVTVAKLIRREGLVLHLDRLDLVDGTPVIDLKPYIPGQDTVFCATRLHPMARGRLPSEVLASFLIPDLERHLGPWSEHLAARMALLALMAAVHRLGVDPRDERLSVVVSRADAAADALMGLMGATFSSGRIEIAPAAGPRRFRFAFEGTLLDLVETERTALALAEPGCLEQGVDVLKCVEVRPHAT